MQIIKSAKNLLRNILNMFFKKKDFLIENKKNKLKKCYICGEEFEKFYKYYINNTTRNAASYFQLIGSDTENYGCYYCKANDRERHLFMFFDKLNIWEKFKDSRILHIAPEFHLMRRIEKLVPLEYVKGDFNPKEGLLKIDITEIQYSDNYFDAIICNHVLEHVNDYFRAIKELARVLKPKGFAILQTPYSVLLFNNFEDPGINTPELKFVFYGQEDHARIISKRQLFEDLENYFSLNIVRNDSLFNESENIKYGINKDEDLVMVIKQDAIR